MKKIIIFLLLAVVLIAAGIAVFLVTFDLNRYNRAISSQIESVIGNPVEIGHISLKWKKRLSLDIEKFTILIEKGGQNVSGLSFDRGDMALEILPLFKKQLKVSSISVMRPNIHIVRAKDGSIEVVGYSPKHDAAAAQPAASPIAASSVFDFSIDSIIIRNGSARFQDFTMEPPADISIDSIDADIKDVSLDKPVQFNIKMALLAAKQNMEISGLAGGFASKPLYVKDLDARMDIGAMDYSKLMKAIPVLQKTGLQDGSKGILKAEVDELRLDGSKVEKLSANINLDEGRLILAALKAPIENVSLSASAEDDKVSIRSFSARLANATLKSSADISDAFKTPNTVLRLDAQIPSVKEFLSSSFGGRQYLDGKIAFAFAGSMTGSSWDMISKTMSGDGTLSIDNGVVLDTNILRQSLGALYMFPGLLDSIGLSVPGQVKDALSNEYTLLKPVNQKFSVKDGVAALPELGVETDFAQLYGAADLTLQGELNGKGIIVFSKEISDAMIKAFDQMRYIANQQGFVEFPVAFNASGRGVSIAPDLQYIAAKVAMQKGQEIVSDLLKKATENKDASQPAPAAEDKKKSTSLIDIMNRVKAATAEKEGGS